MSSYFPTTTTPSPYVVYMLTYIMMNIFCNAFKHIPAACLIILLGNYYKNKKKENRTLFQTTKNKKR